MAYPDEAKLHHSLNSIFSQKGALPKVHMHLRLYDVVKDVPIGNIDNTDDNGQPNDATPDEKRTFETWLCERWREKDTLMARYVEDGSFVASSVELRARRVEIPVQLRRAHEIGRAFSWGLPILFIYALVQIMSRVSENF